MNNRDKLKMIRELKDSKFKGPYMSEFKKFQDGGEVKPYQPVSQADFNYRTNAYNDSLNLNLVTERMMAGKLDPFVGSIGNTHGAYSNRGKDSGIVNTPRMLGRFESGHSIPMYERPRQEILPYKGKEYDNVPLMDSLGERDPVKESEIIPYNNYIPTPPRIDQNLTTKEMYERSNDGVGLFKGVDQSPIYKHGGIIETKENYKKRTPYYKYTGNASMTPWNPQGLG